MNHINSLLLLFIGLLLISCSGEQKDIRNSESHSSNVAVPEKYQDLDDLRAYDLTTTSVPEVTFEKVLTFDPEGDQLAFSHYYFAVDDSGRVYIPNPSEKSIKVFSDAGKFLTTLGRKGRGPGEFSNMAGLRPVASENRLFVYDDVQMRINIYDLNMLEAEGSILLEPSSLKNLNELKGTRFEHLYTLSDSVLLISFSERTDFDDETDEYTSYYKVNLNGDIISDEILRHKDLHFYSGSGPPAPYPPGPNVTPPNPSTHNVLFDLSETGIMTWTDNHDMLIKQQSAFKEEISQMYYKTKQVEIDLEKIVAQFEWNKKLQRIISDRSLPEFWPEANRILSDDKDRLWIQTITENDTHYQWWVTGPEGDPLATFLWPGKKLQRHTSPSRILQIKNGYLYSLEPVSEGSSERRVTKFRYSIN